MKKLIISLATLNVAVGFCILLLLFFPSIGRGLNGEKWLFFAVVFIPGISFLALLLGMDLFNRMEIYREFKTAENPDRVSFWKGTGENMRLQFLGKIATPLIVVGTIFIGYLIVHSLMKSPSDGHVQNYVFLSAGILCAMNVIYFMNTFFQIVRGKAVLPESVN